MIEFETETVEQGESSQPDPNEVMVPEVTESPESEPGVEKQGVEEQEEGTEEPAGEAGEAGEGEIAESEPELKKGIPPENTIKMKERLIEKGEKRIRELESENRRLQVTVPSSPPIDPAEYAERISRESGGFYTAEEAKSMIPFVSRVAEDIAAKIVEQRMAPMRGTVAVTQYENIKKTLRADTDEFPDFADLEPEIDKHIEGYKQTAPHLLGNEQALRSLAKFIRGDKALAQIKSAEKRGREGAMKNKQIVGALNVNSGIPAKFKATAGPTPADKVFAEQRNVSPEFARKLRLKRETNLVKSNK